MKRRYTKKQIQEAISYWRKQLAKGNYRKVNEAIRTTRIRPDRWYIVDNNMSVENADNETQERVMRGELDFYDGAETEMFISSPCTYAGYATAEEANRAAFAEWGSYTGYNSYEDWLADQELEFPGEQPLFSVAAGNGDSDPMDRFESEINVMNGRDLINQINH